MWLTRRGTPVDPVTVLWEAQQHGLLNARTVPKELLDLLAVPVGAPEHWGERILQRSVLATAHQAGRHIEAFTDDPATTPYQLVVGSHRALADLSAVRTRWQHATAPEPTRRPARTRATAAPRAGPPTTAPPAVRISRRPQGPPAADLLVWPPAEMSTVSWHPSPSTRTSASTRIPLTPAP